MPETFHATTPGMTDADCIRQGHSPNDHDDPTAIRCHVHGMRYVPEGHAYACPACVAVADQTTVWAPNGVPVAAVPDPTPPEVSAFYRELGRKLAAQRAGAPNDVWQVKIDHAHVATVDLPGSDTDWQLIGRYRDLVVQAAGPGVRVTLASDRY